jgi:hypothetical protein
MQFPESRGSSGTGIQVYECAEHGLYHFGHKIDLTPGPSPER